MSSTSSSFDQILNQEVKVGRRSLNLGRALFFLSVVASTWVYLWRAQFGVDLTDEAFYLLPAWKMIPFGDRPFIDEIFNGVRHNDLLNSFLIQPLTQFNVLSLRRLAVLFYSSCLLFFTWVAFRGRPGVTASLLFPALLTFDYFLIPTWSYNWWARDALLIHHALLMLALRNHSYFVRQTLTVLGGACLGVAVVAYNSLFPLIPVAIIALVFLNRLWRHKSAERISEVWYTLGILLAVGIDVAYIAGSGLGPAWLSSAKAMASMSEYVPGAAFIKLQNLFWYLIKLGDFWFVLGVAFLLTPYASWSERLTGRLGEPLERVIPWLMWPSVAFLVARAGGISNPMTILGAFTGLGFAALPVLILRARAHKDPVEALLAIVAAAGAVGIAASSTNHYLAFYWLVPLLAIPFAAAFTDETAIRQSPLASAEGLREAGGVFALGGFFVFLALGAFQYQRLNTYYDVPPGNCLTTVKSPPLRGLKTSERRAYLVHELNTLTRGHEYVLAFADIPGAYLFSEARAAVDTTIVESEGAPRALNVRSLQNMVERKRIPTLMIRAKVHPWYWGIHHPQAKEPMKYPADDAYTAFAECARGPRVADHVEFEAFHVVKSKVEPCVIRLAQPAVVNGPTKPNRKSASQ